MDKLEDALFLWTNSDNVLTTTGTFQINSIYYHVFLVSYRKEKICKTVYSKPNIWNSNIRILKYIQFWFGRKRYRRFYNNFAPTKILKFLCEHNHFPTFFCLLRKRYVHKPKNFCFEKFFIRLNISTSIFGYETLRYIHGEPPRTASIDCAKSIIRNNLKFWRWFFTFDFTCISCTKGKLL